jgi:hypothetical protein
MIEFLSLPTPISACLGFIVMWGDHIIITVIHGYHACDSRLVQQWPTENTSVNCLLATFTSVRLCEKSLLAAESMHFKQRTISLKTLLSCGKYALSTARHIN